MDFKDIAEKVAAFGLPLLGAALPLPGGAAIGAALASYISSPSAKPEDILNTLANSADAVLKAKQFESEHSEKITDMYLNFLTAQDAAQSNIIIAEAKGESWLQRNWRPFMMLTFMFLLVSYWFGYSPPNMTQETLNNVFALLKLGIGGYIGGRSLEKITPHIAAAIHSIKNKGVKNE